MMRAVYLLLGLTLLGAARTGEVRGWFSNRPATLSNVPRSIRDNPGAYRSLYAGSPRYFGGK